jgi:hypothetical protein
MEISVMSLNSLTSTTIGFIMELSIIIRDQLQVRQYPGRPILKVTPKYVDGN